jgi:2-polyprenyl-6-methoxyphenol hydroxylase-like FAD-dependent oxidoreductase
LLAISLIAAHLAMGILRLYQGHMDQATADYPPWSSCARGTCPHGSSGRAVLLRGTAAPLPPIGQGLNAALESAIVLALPARHPVNSSVR